jgi:hypothetical protein
MKSNSTCFGRGIKPEVTASPALAILMINTVGQISDFFFSTVFQSTAGLAPHQS